MLQPHFEVPAIGVDRSKSHPVAEHHLQIDNVGRDLDTAIARRHAGEAEYAVGPELRHRLKGYRAAAGAFENEVDLSELILDARHRVVGDALIGRTQLREDAALQ